MSADNYLLVSNNNFKVMSMCASSQRGVVIFNGNTLEEAKEFAFEQDLKGYYEYGLRFTDNAIGNRYKDKILEEKQADMEFMKDFIKNLKD